MSETQEISFSFLTSGPFVTFSAPVDLLRPPQLSSPIVSGVGARSFDFTPSPLDAGMADGMARDAELIDHLADRDGRAVELYARQDPIAWWLRWQLRGGSLATHLREEDGIERAYTAVGSISVDDDGPTPFILLYSPLFSAVSPDPRLQEEARTFGTGSTTVNLLRPGFVAPGNVVAATTPDWYGLRAGTEFGMEVQVASKDSAPAAEDVMNTILESLKEGLATSTR